MNSHYEDNMISPLLIPETYILGSYFEFTQKKRPYLALMGGLWGWLV